jgi:hypothetical protein
MQPFPTTEVFMRKELVSEFVTLDGVTEDPGGAEGFEHGGSHDTPGSSRRIIRTR